MAFDFSQISDEQLEAVMQSMIDTPSGHDPEIRKATVAEYNRRLAARNAPKPAAPPANVQANLDAAATPITPEPVAGPAKPKAAPAGPTKWEDMTDEEINANIYDYKGNPLPGADTASPDELEAYGQKYIDANRRIYEQRVEDRKRARAAGYEDPEQLAYNEATGVRPEDYVAAGRPMPSAYVPAPPLPAEPVSEDDPDYWQKRYQQEVVGPPQAEPSDSVGRVDAYFADKAKRSESGHLLPQHRKPTFDEFVADQSQQQIRERANQDIATYGSSYATATPEQRDARDARTKSENMDRAGRVDQIIDRLASQTGASRAEIRARANDPKLGITWADGLSPQEVALIGQPFMDKAKDARDAELAERRAFLRRRGMMAGSNVRATAANNWADMPADWQNFVRAGGRGQTPLDVQGAHNAQLTALGLRVAQGQGFQNMSPEQRAVLQSQMNAQNAELPPEHQSLLHVQEDAVHPSELDYADTYVGNMYSSNWNWFGTSTAFTPDEQQLVIDHLVTNRGYTPAKAQRIVDEIARRRAAQSWSKPAAGPAAAAPAPSNPTAGAM